jgi:hypothetical protein
VPDRPKGPRSGPAARSGPSGPSIPRAQRKRPGIEVYLSPEALERLAAEVERTEESRSALIEALVLTGTPEHYLSPALLEQMQAVAAREGRTLHDCLCSAVDCWLTERDTRRVAIAASSVAAIAHAQLEPHEAAALCREVLARPEVVAAEGEAQQAAVMGELETPSPWDKPDDEPGDEAAPRRG